MRRSIPFLALLMLLPATPSLADDARLKVSAVTRADGTLGIWAVNATPGHLTVDLDVQGTNLAIYRQQRTFVIAGRSRVLAAVVGPAQRGAGFSYNASTYYYLGSNAGTPDQHPYRLPFANGVSAHCGQGYFGAWSHQQERALDFSMPEGTSVVAARSGVVVDTQASYTTGGADKSFAPYANYISVEQADGTIARYLHLKPGGVLVSVGQRVKAGQAIGLSGNTGWSTQPHLHFEVDRPLSGRTKDTVPTTFITTEAPDGTSIEAGHTYTASGASALAAHASPPSEPAAAQPLAAPLVVPSPTPAIEPLTNYDSPGMLIQ